MRRRLQNCHRPGGGSGEIPFRGTVHVRHAILQLFFGEAVKEDGKISVLVQPDFDFAMELLQVFGEQNPNLTIQHLFCMNNNEKMVSMRKNYNLSCLQKILRLRLPCAVLLRQCDGTAE